MVSKTRRAFVAVELVSEFSVVKTVPLGTGGFQKTAMVPINETLSQIIIRTAVVSSAGRIQPTNETRNTADPSLASWEPDRISGPDAQALCGESVSGDAIEMASNNTLATRANTNRRIWDFVSGIRDSRFSCHKLSVAPGKPNGYILSNVHLKNPDARMKSPISVPERPVAAWFDLSPRD